MTLAFPIAIKAGELTGVQMHSYPRKQWGWGLVGVRAWTEMDKHQPQSLFQKTTKLKELNSVARCRFDI